jgi:hypothetical protein
VTKKRSSLGPPGHLAAPGGRSLAVASRRHAVIPLERRRVLAFPYDMNCTSCGAPLGSGPFCPSCGARQGGQTAPPADGWQAVGQQVSSVTVAVSTTCTHCAEPVPVNGPSASLHCSHCDQDMPLPPGLGEAIRAASAGYRLVGGVGAAFWVQSGEASPECPRCGQAVSIAAYVDRHGATAAVPCAACGASVPTDVVAALAIVAGPAGALRRLTAIAGASRSRSPPAPSAPPAPPAARRAAVPSAARPPGRA